MIWLCRLYSGDERTGHTPRCGRPHDHAERPFPKGGERGMVVLLVLLMMTVLAFLAVEVSRQAVVDRAGSAGLRASLAGHDLLGSGLVAAGAVLAEDMREGGGDHRYDIWNDLDVRLREASENLRSGELSGDASDENRFLPINNLVGTTEKTKAEAKLYQGIFLRLLEGLCEAHSVDGDPELFLRSLRYWLGDPEAKTYDNEKYASREPVYSRRGAAFRSPEELMLVHWEGVNDEDFRRVMRGADGIPGLLDYVSVWAPGPLNMNTAPKELIMAMVSEEGLRREYADTVEEYRAGAEHGFAGDWYRDLALGLGIRAASFPSGVLASDSDYFRLRLKASAGAAKSRLFAVVRRDTKGISEVVYRIFY